MLKVKCSKCGIIYLWPAVMGWEKTCPNCNHQSDPEDTKDLY